MAWDNPTEMHALREKSGHLFGFSTPNAFYSIPALATVQKQLIEAIMQAHKTHLLVSIAVILLSSTASAEESVLHEIDRRKVLVEKNDYYVALCARGDSPTGHAYVAIGIDDHDAKACRGSSFGLYPKDGKIGVFGVVPGKIVDETLAKSTHRLLVRIDSKQYAQVMAIKKGWADRGEYRLIEKDCVTFVGKIAKAIGVKTPDRTDAIRPQAFIQKSIDLNKK